MQFKSFKQVQYCTRLSLHIIKRTPHEHTQQDYKKHISPAPNTRTLVSATEPRPPGPISLIGLSRGPKTTTIILLPPLPIINHHLLTNENCTTIVSWEQKILLRIAVTIRAFDERPYPLESPKVPHLQQLIIVTEVVDYVR